jgi:hemolysin III
MLNDILKKVKNPGSAATHGIAMIGSAIAAGFLISMFGG